MKISTRNLLAASCSAALADPVSGRALRCIAARRDWLRSSAEPVHPEELVALLAPVERADVLAVLRDCALLDWGTDGRVSLAPSLVAEAREVAPRLARYAVCLDRWTPDRAEVDLTTTLRKGILLFNQHLFFEVHEVLEEQWMHETGTVKTFLQGLIQIAVAFYHLENGNLAGVLSLLRDGVDKIAPLRPVYLGIELSEFVGALESCRGELARLGRTELRRFRPATIPRLRPARSHLVA